MILEPDALGNMPSDCSLPAGANYPFTDQGRITDLTAAVSDLEADQNTAVYLDGTHSAWQQVGNIAQRLVEAGVQQAQGFYLNVSNYQYTSNNIAYGSWISDCIAFAQGSGAIGSAAVQPGTYQTETSFFNNSCPNQYWNGGPATNFQGVAMNNYVPWNDQTPSARRPPRPGHHRRDQQRLRERPGLGERHPGNPLRHRHQPQRRWPEPDDRGSRPGHGQPHGRALRPVSRRHQHAPDGQLVQPAWRRQRPPPDGEHRRGAGRRLPLGQDPR